MLRLSHVILGVFVIFGLATSAYAGPPDCGALAGKLNRVNLTVGTATASEIFEWEVVTANPRGGTMPAVRTTFIDAGWMQSISVNPRRFVFENGDVYWNPGVTHFRIFVGSDGSGMVWPWRNSTGSPTPEICNTIGGADSPGLSTDAAALHESLCRDEYVFTAPDGTTYAVSLTGEAACLTP